jgi:hypothetical protein
MLEVGTGLVAGAGDNAELNIIRAECWRPPTTMALPA